MKEVALELEGLLRAIEHHPWIHQESSNFEESEYLLGGIHVDYLDTGPISMIVSEATMKNQMMPFSIDDAR